MTTTPPLILASSSPYRRELLDRLAVPYSCQSPDIDETPEPGESAEQLVRRLAVAKARAVAKTQCPALIIGCDQVSVLHGKIAGKPGDFDRAVAQLRAASGQTLDFVTGLCLLNSGSAAIQQAVVYYRVTFRELDEAMIEDYLRREQPYQCAGAFKSEGLGIALIARMDGADPTALIGLPLIELVTMLRAQGVAVPG
ncbi:MAG: septum formation inhibitor Maf [Gammaproteobacteria bacterium]|nr:septum formation inhibitor Maf [Gammaproteobacteria bacterium]